MEEQRNSTSPSPLFSFNSPSIRTGASSLFFDGHELRALTRHLSLAMSPWRSSRVQGTTPTLEGSKSNLYYDSCELDAVVRQLNGAIRATRNGTTICRLQNKSCYTKQNRLMGYAGGKEVGNDRGVLSKLWKKVKRAILSPKKS